MRWCPVTCRRVVARALSFAAAVAPDVACEVEPNRAPAARCEDWACGPAGRDAGPSLVPITARTSSAATGTASTLQSNDPRPTLRTRPSLGVRSPATGGTRPTGGSTRSGLTAGGAWTASCSAAESSLQKASAVGGAPSSASRCAARALAAGPMGTSSSGGPSQSRGRRMTFSSLRVSPPLSSVRPLPVSTGLQTFPSPGANPSPWRGTV